jgi:hypothetical protein
MSKQQSGEQKMIPTNKFIGVENLVEIEETLPSTQYKYSTVFSALVSACNSKGLKVLKQEIAVSQNFKIFYGLIEVQEDGLYNLLLGIQMSWGSSNVKTKWGCAFKEEDIKAFPVSEVEGGSNLINGIASAVIDLDLWQLKIEEALDFLGSNTCGEKTFWGEFLYQLAFKKGIIPSSQIVTTLKDWTESNDLSLLGFYSTLCKKLSNKEPGVMFRTHEELLKTKYFTPECPLTEHLEPTPANNQSEDEPDYEPINDKVEDELNRETEPLSYGEEEEDESLAIAAKYI